MILDMASAAIMLVVLMIAWFTPVTLVLLRTQLQGSEKFKWALLVGFLTWPAYGLYLFMLSGRGRDS